MGSEAQVDALATRLRMIQADLADLDPQSRREHLADEVEQSLSAMVPDERRAFLAALGERFPTWEPQATSTEQADDEDAEVLINRLSAMWRNLSEEDRQGVSDKLVRAGLVRSTAAAGDLPPASAGRLAESLKATEGTNFEAGPVADLATALATFAGSMDQLAWSTWKQVAPKSTVRRRAPLRDTMLRFLNPDQDASRAQVEEDLERLRQLTASLISSLSQVGQLSRRAYARFTPEEIEAFAKEEKRAWDSIDTAAWKKYKELAGDLDEAAVEAEILSGVASYAEELIQGLAR